MPSLLPGYEYDVFISYRQKDNKYDGWVTEFVGNLRKELEATFKEDISIYFDENPHDGLLETHDVDKSLVGKLRCLVFIPILSQTYCDPKSFAWQNEFRAFHEFAKQDQFGTHIKLSSGNVSGRILPVKIHELEAADKATIETEMGGPLRAIEFIYSEPGVNRPLTPDDNKNENLNKTGYRNQVNKVANAIKDLIHAMQVPANKTMRGNQVRQESIPKGMRRQITIGAVALLTLSIIAFVIFYFTGFKKALDLPEKSIAVLPFENMNNDPEQEYFCDGTTEQVISSLARLKDIKVIARTSVMKYKNTAKSIREIGKELHVTHILEGSVRKSGDQIRVTAQLIAVSNEYHLWAEDFDNKSTADIFQIQDDVSLRIASSLKSHLLPQDKERLRSDRPSNPEAYEHYLKGEFIHSRYMNKVLHEDFKEAEGEFKSAIGLDSNYATAYAALSNLYDTRANLSTSTDEVVQYRKLNVQFADKAYRLNPFLPYALLAKFESWAHYPFMQRDSAFKYIRSAYEASPNSAGILSELGMFYCYNLGICDQGLAFLKKAGEINPMSSVRYMQLAFLYYSMQKFADAEESAKKTLSFELDNFGALTIYMLLNSDRKNFQEAEKFLERIKTLNPNQDHSYLEARILAEKGDKRALEKSKAFTIYLVLKMKEEALSSLEETIDLAHSGDDRFYHLAFEDPHFDFLREEPRFKKILVRANEVSKERIRKYGLAAPR